MDAANVLRTLSKMNNKATGKISDTVSKFAVFANSQDHISDFNLMKAEKGFHPVIEIFSNDFRLTTILVILIYIVLSLGNYSFFIFVPRFLKMSSGRDLSYNETYLNFTIVSLCQIPGYLFLFNLVACWEC
jgi:hypothetical protein